MILAIIVPKEYNKLETLRRFILPFLEISRGMKFVDWYMDKIVIPSGLCCETYLLRMASEYGIEFEVSDLDRADLTLHFVPKEDEQNDVVIYLS